MLNSLSEPLKLALLKFMSAGRKRILGEHVRALLVESKNGRFLVDAADQKVGRHLAYGGQYASDELDRLIGFLEQDSTLLVVGAHIGTLVVEASRHCKQVFAIEANPDTFQLLQLNLLINDCTNVRALQMAAGDKNEEIQFVMSKVNSGGSKRMPLQRSYRYFYDSPTVINTRAQPLDDALLDLKPDVILMDIEGSEYLALKGMQRLLATARVLLMEFIPNHLKEVAGISVPEFVSVLAQHFSSLEIPSKSLLVDQQGFCGALQNMYDRNESDFCIIFQK